MTESLRKPKVQFGQCQARSYAKGNVAAWQNEPYLIRILHVLVLVVALLASATQQAQAGASASHLVSFRLDEFNDLQVSGDPGVLIVDTATAGLDPDAASDATTTYQFTVTSQTGTQNIKKITAVLNQEMPSYYTLNSVLGTPTGATSLGNVTLRSFAREVVTNIDASSQSGLSITYELIARARGGALSGSRIVTFTIQDTGF